MLLQKKTQQTPHTSIIYICIYLHATIGPRLEKREAQIVTTPLFFILLSSLKNMLPVGSLVHVRLKLTSNSHWHYKRLPCTRKRAGPKYVVIFFSSHLINIFFGFWYRLMAIIATSVAHRPHFKVRGALKGKDEADSLRVEINKMGSTG